MNEFSPDRVVKPLLERLEATVRGKGREASR
jgi:hypothetical protein